MADNKLQIILDEQGVAKENAKQLLEAFGAPFEEAGEILKDYKTIVVTDAKQTDLMNKARTKRLALKKTRVEVEHKRKELKADILKTGQAIDSVAKFVKQVIEPAEEYLQLQEDFAAIQEARRLEERKAKRIEKLSKYTDDVSAYNLDEMTDESFNRLIDMLTDIKAREEAEAKIAERVYNGKI